MKRIIVTALVGLLCAAGAAGAQERPGVSAQEAVQARRASMMMSGAVMASIKASIDAQASPRGQAFASGALARWGRAMPGMFPAGSGQGDLGEEGTGAKAGIWTDRADFEAKAAAFAEAAAQLNAMSRADDAAGFATQWTAVRASCQACHDVYKAD